MKHDIQSYYERYNGKGYIHIEQLTTPQENGEFVKMYARVTIEPHASIGYHQHLDDGEAYYIISGEGLYCEDNETIKVKANDHTFCKPNSSHSIENTSDEPLVLIALIIKNTAMN